MSDPLELRRRKETTKVSAKIDDKLLAWVDKMIERHRFKDRTAAIELGIQLLKEKYEDEGKD